MLSALLRAKANEHERGHKYLHINDELTHAGRLETARRLWDHDCV